MKIIKRLNEKEDLLNAKKSYSLKGAQGQKGFEWTKAKKNLIISNIKNNKEIIAYRTFSLSERDWGKLFEKGYTEIGNVNKELNLSSFTLSRNMMRRFGGGGEETIRLEIKLNKYIKILDDSVYPEEQEILTSNLIWEVTGVKDYSQGWFLEGKQI